MTERAVFVLSDAGVINPADINVKLVHTFCKYKSNEKLMKYLYWYLPELYASQHVLYKQVIFTNGVDEGAMIATNFASIRSQRLQYPEMAQILIDDDVQKLQEMISQPNFNINQMVGKQPLIYQAAFYQSIKCFKFLLLNGASINYQDNNFNRSIFYYALSGGSDEISQLLVEAFESSDLQMPPQMTRYATLGCNTSVIDWCLSHETEDIGQNLHSCYRCFTETNELRAKYHAKTLLNALKQGDTVLLSHLLPYLIVKDDAEDFWKKAGAVVFDVESHNILVREIKSGHGPLSTREKRNYYVNGLFSIFSRPVPADCIEPIMKFVGKVKNEINWKSPKPPDYLKALTKAGVKFEPPIANQNNSESRSIIVMNAKDPFSTMLA